MPAYSSQSASKISQWFIVAKKSVDWYKILNSELNSLFWKFKCGPDWSYKYEENVADPHDFLCYGCDEGVLRKIKLVTITKQLSLV